MTERRRASADERARRVNAAAELLAARVEAPEAARRLARRFDVSERQGRRYVDAAREQGGQVTVPEPTVVFTVRLPVGLAERLRAHAATSGRTLSLLVAEACEGWLERRQRGRRRG